MELDPETTVRILRRHGDLNAALIREYVRAYGKKSERQVAQDVGLSRDTVRRALLKWSDSDHPKKP